MTVKNKKEKNKNLRMILKFDSGADGFEYMMAVLAISAVIVLILGIYFIKTNFSL